MCYIFILYLEKNCSECTSFDFCTKCSNGFSLSGSICVQTCEHYSESFVCQECKILNCVKCTNSTQCKACKEGYSAIFDQCKKDCEIGQYRYKSGECVKCVLDNCIDCQSAKICKDCKKGYFGKTCQKCHDSCENCIGTSFQQCVSCDKQKNLFLFQNECISKCKDGFYISGLDQCIACSDSNCKQCQKTNQCSLCKNSTDYLVGYPYYTHCSSSCQQEGYLAFIKNNIKYCLKLDCGFGKQQIDDKCVDICGDGQNIDYECDDGNSINGDGCNSQCKIEESFICEKKNIQIQKQIYNKSFCYFPLNYSVSSTNQTNEILLTFNTDIKIPNNNNNPIEIQVPSLNDKFYNSTIQQIKQNTLRVFIDFKIQVPSQLNILVKNSFIKDKSIIDIPKYPNATFQLIEKEKDIKINTKYIPTELVQQQSQSVQTTTKVFSTTIIASMAPIALAGGVTLVVSIIDISQIIKMHQYIDIIHPFNLQSYFKAFDGFDFSFITNIFDFMTPMDHKKNTYESFNRNGMQAFYLANAGQHYSLFGLSLILHGILKLIGKKIKKLDAYVDKMFKYAIYHEVIMSVYLEIMFASFLQWTNMTTDITMDYLNLLLMFTTFFTFLPFPFIFAFMMKKYFSRLEEESIKSRFGCLWDGLRNEYSCMIYYVFLHIRKLIFSFLIVFLNPSTIVQCSLLSTIPFSLIIYVWVKKPFIKKSENIKQIIQESCLTISQFLLIGLKTMDGQFEVERLNLSWGIIVFLTIIILMHFFCSLLEIYHLILLKPTKYLYKKIMNECMKLRSSKATVFPQKINMNDVVSIQQQENNLEINSQCKSSVQLNFVCSYRDLSSAKQDRQSHQIQQFSMNQIQINNNDNTSHIDLSKIKNEQIPISQNITSFQDLGSQQLNKPETSIQLNEKPMKFTSRKIPRSHTQKSTFIKKVQILDEIQSPTTSQIQHSSTRIIEFPSTAIFSLNENITDDTIKTNLQILTKNNFFQNDESTEGIISPSRRKRTKIFSPTLKKQQQRLFENDIKEDDFEEVDNEDDLKRKQQESDLAQKLKEVNQEIKIVKQKIKRQETNKSGWK